MNKNVIISSIDALKWYDAMGVDSVLSTDPNRWDVVLPTIKKPSQTSGIKNTTSQTAIPNINSMNSGVMVQDIVSASRILADKATNLDELKASVLAFDGCDLTKTATNTVFGDGIATSKIMLIGEAPGASEDATGIPFCGDSGKLLDNAIASIGLTRSKNIYITNTVFWRPPANRRPTDEEISICRPFVEKHIALVKPDLLILVGATAVTSLLGDFQISKIRQEYYQYQNQYLAQPITTTAIFHPAYLMRQPFQKKATWYDLLKIQEYLAILGS